MFTRIGLTKRDGFSIAELLVAAAIMVIVMAVTYNFYLVAAQAWRYVMTEGRMQRDALMALEMMAHGAEADHKGIHEAQGLVDITLGADEYGNMLEFIDQDNDAVSRVFYLDPSNNQLTYVDDAGGATILIESGVVANPVPTGADNESWFYRDKTHDNLVKINLVLEEPVAGPGADRTARVRVRTQIELRNM
jgi:prepilin-type N-terminal cleavage/methylation domain-containing protein